MHELYVIDGMLDEGEAEEGALSWQERSLCAQTDPEAFLVRSISRPIRDTVSSPTGCRT